MNARWCKHFLFVVIWQRMATSMSMVMTVMTMRIRIVIDIFIICVILRPCCIKRPLSSPQCRLCIFKISQSVLSYCFCRVFSTSHPILLFIRSNCSRWPRFTFGREWGHCRWLWLHRPIQRCEMVRMSSCLGHTLVTSRYRNRKINFSPKVAKSRLEHMETTPPLCIATFVWLGCCFLAKWRSGSCWPRDLQIFPCTLSSLFDPFEPFGIGQVFPTIGPGSYRLGVDLEAAWLSHWGMQYPGSCSCHTRRTFLRLVRPWIFFTILNRFMPYLIYIIFLYNNIYIYIWYTMYIYIYIKDNNVFWITIVILITLLWCNMFIIVHIFSISFRAWARLCLCQLFLCATLSLVGVQTQHWDEARSFWYVQLVFQRCYRYHISVGSNIVQKALRLLSHRSHSNLGLKMILINNFKSELLTWIGSVSVPGWTPVFFLGTRVLARTWVILLMSSQPYRRSH